MTRRRMIVLGFSAGVLLVIGFLGWQGVQAWWAWSGIERVDFDLADARDRLFGFAQPDRATDEYDTVLAIGSDERTEGYAQNQEGSFADAVLFWLQPMDGTDPILVSLPRDLLMIDPCTGEETKLDRMLSRCGEDVSGPERVALAVEDFTGIGVDHFALFGFDAFVDVIDAVGGVEICVDYAFRSSWMELPAGCSVVDGPRALKWIRSRSSQELVNGEWQLMEGESDRTRSERQQALLFALLAKLKSMRSPSTVAEIAGSLGHSLALDDDLSMSDAVGIAWNLRSIPASDIRQLVVPTEPVVTADGSFALRSTVPFRELLGG